MKKILFTILVLFFPFVGLAQVPEFFLDSLKAFPGDSVIFRLSAKNVSGIGAITLKIKIDTNSLAWGRSINWNGQLEGALSGKIKDCVVLAWDGLSGFSLEDGDVAELKFLYKGASSDLSFDTAGSELADLSGNVVSFVARDGHISLMTDVENVERIPSNFSLSQNFPNPFNPSTIISYSVPKASFVAIKVYDLLGREVVTLVNEQKSVGNYQVEFNAKGLPSGIYFYKMDAGNFSETKKLLLLK